VGVLTWAAPVLAQQLGVGFYVPETELGAYKRFAFVNKLADQLSKTLKVRVTGYTHKSRTDFWRDIKAGRIQCAVVGGIFVAEQRGWDVVAMSGKPLAWNLMSKRKIKLSDLRGKTLQMPRLGKLVHGLVQHGLLQNNVQIKSHFVIYPSPELISAIKAVRLDQADLVFAPVKTKGLFPLLAESVEVPPPAFVVLDRKVSAAKARKAVLALKGSWGALARWRAATPGSYKRLRALASRRRLLMLMARPALQSPKQKLFDEGKVKLELPPIRSAFKVP
jgi:hypothetical protein